MLKSRLRRSSVLMQLWEEATDQKKLMILLVERVDMMEKSAERTGWRCIYRDPQCRDYLLCGIGWRTSNIPPGEGKLVGDLFQTFGEVAGAVTRVGLDADEGRRLF